LETSILTSESFCCLLKSYLSLISSLPHRAPSSGRNRRQTEHHDIGFYASELCITTTYLSRVVRQVSGGRTVACYINQLLLMEATFLLRQTSFSIALIADRLHFAETTTFARFFYRMKGINPREFRKGK
jgi:AraC-like DNA-binding protein